jgi:hypothetical protein
LPSSPLLGLSFAPDDSWARASLGGTPPTNADVGEEFWQLTNAFRNIQPWLAVTTLNSLHNSITTRLGSTDAV